MKLGIEHSSTEIWQQMAAWKSDAEATYRTLLDEVDRLRGLDREMEKQQEEYLTVSGELKNAKQKISALETAIKQLTANLQHAEERYVTCRY